MAITYIVEYTQPSHGYRDPNTGRFVQPGNDPGTPAETKKFLSDHFRQTIHYTTYKLAADAMQERIDSLSTSNATMAANEFAKHQADFESPLRNVTVEEWITEFNNLYPVPKDPVVYKVEPVTK